MAYMAKEEQAPIMQSMAGPDVNWDQWDASAQPPADYAPHQLQPAFYEGKNPCCNVWFLYWCDWASARAPVCAKPMVPCCCAGCCSACCTCCTPWESLKEPNEAFIKMLSAKDPNCPDEFKGIWWMEDNIAAEMLMTFQDADWADDAASFKKSLAFNWTRSPTMFGSILQLAASVGHCFGSSYLRGKLSPDKKWIALFENDRASAPKWVYRIQPGDKFALPGGGDLQTVLGDMMRIDWRSPYDTSSEIAFQYRVRRVAYLDNNGKLVKTSAYDDLLGRAQAEPNTHGYCCGYCTCNLSPSEFADIMKLENVMTALRYAPAKK